MEVNIPPEIARELGQDPGATAGEEEEEHVVEKLQQEGLMEDLEDSLDLKKIAADYAQYLAVNSRQDVSVVSFYVLSLTDSIGQLQMFGFSGECLYSYHVHMHLHS